ncbi:hypothetical protein PISL3812_03945 [Talaromyces islandicus]|uniref:Rhodopsin domain-containing protein n=1 Tax=Talaromyces islandicus TaxID=28573 RepID=A0A0U1LV04_TALIS|nr:hypothetical protein PISL3812_03945 [Talaromyces islandicus]
MITIAGLGCIKASVVHLYLRIFKGPALSLFQIIGRSMLGIIVAWTIAFFFCSLFQCTPVTAIVEAYYSREKCVNINRFYNAGCITDIIVDFLVLVLPIPMVLRLQLGFRQRLAILGIFLLGTLAAASSIARLVVYLRFDDVTIVHPDDRAYYMCGIFIVTVLEMDLAIISACLPTLRPLFIGRNKRRLSSRYPTGHSLHSSRSYKRTPETNDELEIPVLSRNDGHGFSDQAV